MSVVRNIATTAISSIIYYYGDTNLVGTTRIPLFVRSVVSELGTVPDPQEDDIVLIINGTNGGYDVAVYQENAWIVKPLKGDKGDKGDVGAKGDTGLTGEKGDPGVGEKGDKGDKGDIPAHQWSNSQLRFQKPDGTWGDYSELRGDQGPAGDPGAPGVKGDKPAHQWDDTSLRFQNPDGSWGVYTDLQGDAGAKGDKGDKGDKGNPGDKGDKGDPGVGTRWFNGLVSPEDYEIAHGPMATNDYYLKIDDGNYWQKAANGTFTYLGTLKAADGLTPYIGENGNWWIGLVDTGVKAGGNVKEIIQLVGNETELVIELTQARIIKFGPALHIVVEVQNDQQVMGSIVYPYTTRVNPNGIFEYVLNFTDTGYVGRIVIS